MNKHLLPLHINDKWKEHETTPRLHALVARVAELRQAGLRACHCTKEFTLQWIHPLGHWEKLAYECPLFTDPNHEPVDGKILTSFTANIELIFRYDNLTLLCSFNHRRGVPAHVIHV
jgi:hypothetical protein